MEFLPGDTSKNRKHSKSNHKTYCQRSQANDHPLKAELMEFATEEVVSISLQKQSGDQKVRRNTMTQSKDKDKWLESSVRQLADLQQLVLF